MSHKQKKEDADNPKPLNFDEDKGTGDYLTQPFMTLEDARGDNEDSQYYEEEEALSPEETKKRKKEESI